MRVRRSGTACHCETRQPMGTWFANLRNRSLPARGTFLGLVVLGLYAMVAPVAGFCSGSAGLWAAAAAAVLCLAGAGLALVLSHALREPKRALYGMLLSMAARMGVPLAVGLPCHLHGGVLAQGGLLYYLLVFYLVTLGVETLLSLPRPEQARQRSKVS